MAKPHLIASLDIGTAKIRVAIAQLNTVGTLEIIGIGQANSRGVRKSEIVNPELAAEDIQRAIVEAEQMARVKLQSVYVAAADESVCSVPPKGKMPVANEILPSAAAAALRQMIGSLLPFTVAEIVFGGQASALALLTNEQMAQGALVIDLGAGTTQYAAYANGLLQSLGALRLGGNHVSNDLAYGLKLPLSRAEKLKLEYGSALVSSKAIGQQINIANDLRVVLKTIQLENLQHIMALRLEEVFHLIAQTLPQTSVADCPHAGIFLCGGGARIPGIAQLAENIFQMKTVMGHITAVGGISAAMDQPEFATAIGLTRYGALHQCPVSASSPPPTMPGHTPSLPKPTEFQGRFAQCKPTIHDGADLDVPTILRRSRPQN